MANGRQSNASLCGVIEEDGHLYLDNLRGAKVTDTYILKGDEEETWEPKFVFHGFRYVEVSGFPVYLLLIISKEESFMTK